MHVGVQACMRLTSHAWLRHAMQLVSEITSGHPAWRRSWKWRLCLKSLRLRMERGGLRFKGSRLGFRTSARTMMLLQSRMRGQSLR